MQTATSERKKILSLTLAYYGAVAAGALLLPAITRAFEWKDSTRILETCLPAAASYLVLAINFIRDPRDLIIKPAAAQILSIVVWAPFVIASTLTTIVFGVYVYSNSSIAKDGVGMDEGLFYGIVAATHSLLVTTTAALAAWLFQPAHTPAAAAEAKLGHRADPAPEAAAMPPHSGEREGH